MEQLWAGLGLAGGLGPSWELSEPDSPSGHWEKCSSSSALDSGLWGIVRGAGHHHWLHCKDEERRKIQRFFHGGQQQGIYYEQQVGPKNIYNDSFPIPEL